MGWGWLCGHWDGVRELCHSQSMNGCSVLCADMWVRSVLHVSGARVGSTEDEETERIPTWTPSPREAVLLGCHMH